MESPRRMTGTPRPSTPTATRCCRGPEAAEVVQDTFIIAVSKLGGLRDPYRLDAWLHAVARNECLHRLGTKGPGGSKGSGYAAGASSAVPGSADPDDVL